MKTFRRLFMKKNQQVNRLESIQVALYARVSSDGQAKQNTIGSQIEELLSKIQEDGFSIREEMKFIDDGFSGSNLERPSLERLREAIFSGIVDRIYIHSPDRLARRYAHQVLLIEEIQQCNAKPIFLNAPPADSLDGMLLEQVQGVIAEYERAKILERTRRGKRHAAKSGKVSAMSRAPYGYKYIKKQEGSPAAFVICDTEANVVRKLFEWVAFEKMSLRQVCKRLSEEGIFSRNGKAIWSASTVRSILKNPAYIGSAAYGKRKVGPKRNQIRPLRGQSVYSKRTKSIYSTSREEWIDIPVPVIIEKNLFDMVQEVLDYNKMRLRQQGGKPQHLLQGLLVCNNCKYAFCGVKKRRRGACYEYYQCSSKSYWHNGIKPICKNRNILMKVLEELVWKEVERLLKNPQIIKDEYERRLEHTGSCSSSLELDAESSRAKQLKKTISRLIDGYGDGLIEKNEFEPRINIAKQKLLEAETRIEELKNKLSYDENLSLAICGLESFIEAVSNGIESIDFEKKRQVIVSLIKEIEISEDNISIVFQIKERIFVNSNAHQSQFSNDCTGCLGFQPEVYG